MGDIVTKADAITIVRQGLDDMLYASLLDARGYLEDHAPLLDDDEFNDVAEDLGAEVEGIILSLDKLCQQWNLPAIDKEEWDL